MDTFLPFSQQLLALYLIGFAGFLAKRKQLMTETDDGVVMRLVLTLTLPSLIISSLDSPFSYTLMKNFSWLLLMSSFVLAAACAIGCFLRKSANLPVDCKSPYEGLIIFGNQGFIGYAVCSFIFGQEGVIYATIFNILYTCGASSK
jgi:predicted permease